MTVWVLNLDAEDELRAAPGPYQPGHAMMARMRSLARSLPGLVGPTDIVVDSDMPPDTGQDALQGQRGAAWCPTPRALARLRAVGAIPPNAPPWQVLRQVNDRAFALTVDAGPWPSRYLHDMDALETHLQRATPGPAGSFVLKRALGYAGRGQRRVRSRLDDSDRRWCVASLSQGLGLVVEPWVERLADFAQHGYLGQDGQLRLGAPTLQTCDTHGIWRGSRQAAGPDLSRPERDALLHTAETVAEALRTAGYFGPFGTDAFRYRDPRTGRPRFHPLVELNARYTMGFGVSGCPRR
ncbi:MAG: ATP-grasp domain-containing protein [Myxococcales bacterium]|nr:ATP-grasp domain-containing protein [Myxococcales bacterium]MDD9964901.1 ATP-grasp domain-containing protein [Myxococcales bacterium]